jgi:hypothetical protein
VTHSGAGSYRWYAAASPKPQDHRAYDRSIGEATPGTAPWHARRRGQPLRRAIPVEDVRRRPLGSKAPDARSCRPTDRPSSPLRRLPTTCTRRCPTFSGAFSLRGCAPWHQSATRIHTAWRSNRRAARVLPRSGRAASPHLAVSCAAEVAPMAVDDDHRCLPTALESAIPHHQDDKA